MKFTRNVEKTVSPLAATVFLLITIILLLGNHEHHCDAFVTPPRALQHTRDAPIIPSPVSELELFKFVDQVRKGSGNKKEGGEELKSIDNNGGIHNANTERTKNTTPSTSIAIGGDKIPFVIERLGSRPKDQVFREIAEMCIA